MSEEITATQAWGVIGRKTCSYFSRIGKAFAGQEHKELTAIEREVLKAKKVAVKRAIADEKAKKAAQEVANKKLLQACEEKDKAEEQALVDAQPITGQTLIHAEVRDRAEKERRGFNHSPKEQS